MADEATKQSAIQAELENGRRDLWLKLYAEACANIHATDDVSFKLLGFVQFISTAGTTLLMLVQMWADTSTAGTTRLTLVQMWADTNRMAVVLISAVGLLITFGLFR